MKAITIAGIALIVLGTVAFFYQGIPLSAERDTIDLGPIKATVKEEKHLPVPPALSIAAIGAGIVLVVLGARK